MTDEYEALASLIQRLDDTPKLDPDSVSQQRAEFLTSTVDKMLNEGASYGQASDDLEIYSLGEAEFKAEMRARDNNLLFQIDTFNHGLDRWFQYGEAHPPYFPMRIAIILSKRKEREREKRFLTAYCRHSNSGRGTKIKISQKEPSRREQFLQMECLTKERYSISLMTSRKNTD